jgi:hypothetical protein
MKRMKQRLVLVSLLIILIVLISTCNSVEPPPPPLPPPPVYKDTITVAVEDVTHRSITVNINTTKNNPNSTIRFFRIYSSNETQVSEYPITVSDTSIIDEGLELNTTYTYYAVRIDSVGGRKDSSNIVQAATFDTTSHNYTWQEFIIGEWQSYLTDVWGTDENNVYAVGRVLINDTSYGIIHWDGVEWATVTSNAGGVAIHGFSDSDIWTVGGGVYHYNGYVWEDYTFRDPVITDNISYSSLWGTSSSNLYFGNVGGKIIHWNGSNAEVVYSSTNILLTDIYGYNSSFMIACGSTLAPPSIALKYQGNLWNRIIELNNNRLFYSVYINTPSEYYIVGQDVLRYRNGQWNNIISNNAVMNKIRGNKVTGEIAIAGHFSTLYHFNGFDWKEFQFTLTNYTPLNSVFLINKKIFAVGSYGDLARIIIGTRN